MKRTVVAARSSGWTPMKASRVASSIRDVEIVVATAPVATRLRSEHAVSTTVGHPTQLLDVDVQQLAGSLADVAHGCAAQSIGMRQAADALPAQDAVHRRARVTQQRSEAVGADPQPTAQAQNAAHVAIGQRARPAHRSCRTVLESGQALGAIAAQPLVGGGATDAHGLGRDGRCPAFNQDPLDQQPPSEGRQLGGTMEHESPPSVWSFNNPKPSTRALNLSTT